jgi:high affinity choline transporter 7
MTTDNSLPAAGDGDSPSEGINVPGLVSILVFYLAVLGVGVWASWRQRKITKAEGKSVADEEDVLLAGRNIGLFVGLLTMGGKEIRHTARPAQSHNAQLIRTFYPHDSIELMYFLYLL